ncbi:PAS domain S-box protein [Breoghania sp.]|uniref:PAS domain S-box protein n=1 Tax=Breoghania sp. TaxID=2065378 RepID=UPI002614CC86|nr:PAS domain S-box protein [Breoghania sp.]MDJ0932812.1 PAS domain S-box protein [Breoghania sp.]
MKSPFHMRFLPGVLLRMLPPAIALMALIAVAAYWQINSVFRDGIARQLDREASMALNDVETRLNAPSSVLESVANNNLVSAALSGPPSRHRRTGTFFATLSLAPMPDVLVGLADTDGRMLLTNGRGRGAPPFVLPSQASKGHKQIDLDSRRVILMVPVMRADLFAGVLFARIPITELTVYLNRTRFADVSLISVNGVPIVPDVTTGEVLLEHAQDGQENWVEATEVSAKHPDLGIVLLFRSANLYEPLRGLDRILGLSALANLTVLVLVLISIAVLVARPIMRLAVEVADVRDASDLSRRVYSCGYLEISRLAGAFNDMLAGLQKTLVSCELLERENLHRRAAERDLHDKQAENTAIVEAVADATIVIDKSGLVHSANPATFEIFGYSPHELIGNNVSMLMPSPHRNNHDQYVRNFLETGEAKIIGMERELEAVRNDGLIFPIELFVANIVLNGEPHFVGMIRDITERRKVDQMQREFIALVSHELRTPLTSLTGSLALVRLGKMGDVPERVRKLVDMAQNNAKRLIDLVNDIMVIEKLQAGRIDLELEGLDLVELVQGVLDDISSYGLKTDISFTLSTELPQAPVLADPKRLVQVLNNLLSNAAKFSERKSEVAVFVERHGRFFRISVRDQGVGICPDLRDQVFDKFVQLDTTDAKNGQGSGLGLSISQAIMNLRGSKIEVESEVGVGSTFYFDLVEFEGDEAQSDQGSLAGSLSLRAGAQEQRAFQRNG